MKVSKLKRNGSVAVIILAASFLFYSCGNDNADKTSLIPETDSPTTTTTVTTTDTSNTGMMSKSVRKTGKVAVITADVNKTDKMATDKMGYYNYAEVNPSFRGGQGAIEDYVTNNIEYPEEAISNDIQGTVQVQFGIDENGNISNVKTIGSKIGYGLEDEAIKVISRMPKWIPGTVKGKNVKTWMVLPITYRLEG